MEHLKNAQLIAHAVRAAFQPSSINEDARTVDIDWTTGEGVMRWDWDSGAYMEELSLDPAHVRMARLNSGTAPFLANHDGRSIDSVLGVIQSSRIEGGKGTATVRFAKDDPAADAAWNKVRQGILPNVSVGYRVHKMEKVSGGAGSTPVFRATDWEPHEVSLVPIGADSAAHVRSDNAVRNSCELIFRENRMNEEEKRAAEQKVAEEKRQAELKATAEAAVSADRARATAIRNAVRIAKLDSAFGEKMVADGTPIDAARAAVLDALATASDAVRIDPPALNIQVGEGWREKFLRGAEAAILTRSGMASLVREMQTRGNEKFKKTELDAGEFSGMSMVRLAQEFLGKSGVNTAGFSDAKIVERAFTFNRGGESSVSDFAVLLENVMYKSLLGNYALADDTWKMFCKTDTVQDFRPSNRYRTGSFGTLPQVPEGAEFTNEAIPDGLKQTLTVQTYGKMISLTRQAIVNDDMGAILDTIGKMGRQAGLTIESAVYTLLNANSGLGANLADSTPFFDASRSNVNGTGSALGVQGIDADRVVLASQKDISANEYLNLAKYGSLTLLVPIGLGGLARNVNKSEWDISQSNKFQVPNIVQGLFGKIVDTPRLSGTRRYLFADPGDAAAIVVAFLNGLETPFMEQKTGWRIDGTEWKIRLDFGVQFFDPKGAVTNAGA